LLASPPTQHAAVYDSWFTTESQLRALDTATFADDYVTQLRLDLLFFRKVVIPDTAVIDGWFFGQTPPDRLLELCGRGSANRDLPLEVRCRADSLEASLAQFLRRPDREMLNDYPLQLFRDRDAREAIRHGLRATPASRLDSLLHREKTVPQAIGRLLSEILSANGITNSTIDQFVPVWEQWIEAERRGTITVSPWRAQLDVVGAIYDDPLDPNTDFLTDRGTAAYREVVGLLGRGALNKSDALNILLDDGSAPESGDDYAWDCATIIDWYDRARARAISRQNEAAFAYDANPVLPEHPLEHFTGLAAEVDLEQLSPDVFVEIPSDFQAALAGVPGADYGNLFATHRDLFASFWREPTADAARAMADAVYRQATASRDPNQTARPEQSMRIFGQILGALGTAAVAGKWAGVGLFVASEATLRLAKTAKQRTAARGVVEYVKRRTQV
jgi:hypothetical protein